MLALSIREFIDSLSRKKSDLSQYDSEFLHAFKERYFLLNPEDNFSHKDFQFMQLILAQRWKEIVNMSFDKTDPKNAEWILLADNLVKEINQSLIHILMPDGLDEPELSIFSKAKLDDIHLDDIHLGELSKTWPFVDELAENVEKSPNILTTFNIKDRIDRPSTLVDLYQIRTKEQMSGLPFSQQTNFWDYLIKQIVPHWQQKGKLNIHLLPTLLKVIESYYIGQESVEHEEKFRQSIAEFINQLSTHSVDDVNHLYSVEIEVEGKKLYLLDILIDCVQTSEDLHKKLNALASWIYKIDRSLIGKSEQLKPIYKSLQATNYLDITKLRRITSDLPIKTSLLFNSRVENFERSIKNKSLIDSKLIDELTAIFALNWQDTIEIPNDYSCFASAHYKSIWQYIIKQYAGDWQLTGSLPTHLLPGLLEVIDAYFEAEDNAANLAKFKCSLAELFSNLCTCSIEDANYFYSTSIECGEQKFYLAEIIIDCMLSSEGVAEKLNALAKKIYQLDHSLIGKNNHLIPVYEALHAGPFADIETFRALVEKLPFDDSASFKLQLENLRQKLKSAEKIDLEFVEDLKEIYALRSTECIDAPNDYMRKVDGENKNWLSLAQYLAGCKKIHSNYYKLLIPTLTHDDDFIIEEPLITYPLTSYILSEDGKELIYLPNCVKYYKNDGRFDNCNRKEPVPLTQKERNRVQFASQYFVDEFNRAEAKKSNSALSKKTIDKIRTLVEESVFTEGLYLGGKYSESQKTLALAAYENFIKFLETIPDEERESLENQQILYDGKWYTFSNVWQKIVYEYECEAVLGKRFIQLVVDYDPYVKFNDELEKKADIPSMRNCSAKKTYKEYDMPQQEAIRRGLIIFVSIMTHSFSYTPFRGAHLHLWDCSNTATNTGSKLYLKLKNAIETENVDSIKFIYASLVETIIKPALADKGLLTSMTRYQDTLKWLRSIVNNSMFKSENATCFDPGVLLSVLWSETEKDPQLKMLFDPFLEQLIQTLSQKQNDYLKWVRINIKFTETLKSLDERVKVNILKALRQFNEPISNAVHNQTIIDFVIHRLAAQVAESTSNKKFRFFKGSKGPNAEIYNSFQTQFRQELNTDKLQDTTSTKELLCIMQRTAKSLTDKFERSPLQTYIQKLTSSIPAIANDTDDISNYQPQVAW